MAALNRGDVLGPFYMFDEEDEAASIVPEARASDLQASGTTTEDPKPQPTDDSTI